MPFCFARGAPSWRPLASAFSPSGPGWTWPAGGPRTFLPIPEQGVPRLSHIWGRLSPRETVRLWPFGEPPDSLSRRRAGMNHLAAASELTAGRAFVAVGRGDDQRVFRAAVRHSRRVRILRVAIP